MDLIILLLIFGVWLILIVIVDSPRVTARFRYWRIAILALALIVYFARGAISDLPRTRPADFAVHHHVDTVFGQSVTTIDISATTCRYYRKSTSAYPQSAPVDIACTVTDTDLDDLYAIVRNQHFDQIRFYGFPNFTLGSDSGGEFYIAVTANGTTYRKDNPEYGLVFGGVEQWSAVDEAIKYLFYLKTRPRADMIIYFDAANQTQITLLLQNLHREPLGRYIMAEQGSPLNGYQSVILDFVGNPTAAQRDAIKNKLSSMALVYRLFESVLPADMRAADLE